MILRLLGKTKKATSIALLTLMYVEAILPAYAFGGTRAVRMSSRTVKEVSMPAAVFPVAPLSPAASVISLPPASAAAPVAPASSVVKAAAKAFGGPTQPETQGFHSVGDQNQVDLFTGDFSYTLPLLDVDGYPLTMGYNSGVSMDQEASWVGLGWTLNPGSVNRNMRGLPDDFNGQDQITKEVSIKENKTLGVTTGFNLEIAGFPKGIVGGGGGVQVGIFHNSYKGWGLEYGLNVSLSAGSKSMGAFTAGLSLPNNSQEGLTLSPSLSYSTPEKEQVTDKGAYNGTFTIGGAYNSRSGMKALQFSAGLRQYHKSKWTKKGTESGSSTFSTDISFAYPGFTPSTVIPFTNRIFTVNTRFGASYNVLSTAFALGGYQTRQYIEEGDKKRSFPAYGYLNYQNGINNSGSLLDFNRERDIPYREYPPVPNIAVPSYTYDVFSISGEGNGGMFRAYRNDLGYMRDPLVSTKDKSDRYSLDVGYGDILHAGVDLTFTRSYTETGMWNIYNPLASNLAFTRSDKEYEAAYFRNPGEKTLNNKTFMDAIGDDDLVTARLFQPYRNSSVITSTNKLMRYANKRDVSDITLPAGIMKKQKRERRTQVISYLTAKEAGEAGLSKYIDSYGYNQAVVNTCDDKVIPDEFPEQVYGLNGDYHKMWDWGEQTFQRVDTMINFMNLEGGPNTWPPSPLGYEYFWTYWTGRLRAPVDGKYQFRASVDEGCRLLIEDVEILDAWHDSGAYKEATVNLQGGRLYNIRIIYENQKSWSRMILLWKYGNMTDWGYIPKSCLVASAPQDSVKLNNGIVREQRVNAYRKPHHISEISVLNNDGRRYVYGIPVYNLGQEEASFSVESTKGDAATGLTSYSPKENSRENTSGNDYYFSKETVPAYAHSFLLTGILSPDYVDATGNGISDDDAGNAVKFNYTKVAGINNPQLWRTPNSNKASYQEGLKTDDRDDKGSYVAGKKELWYLNSVESKNMIAIFTLEDRQDLMQMDATGQRSPSMAKRLRQIDLYTKAEFAKGASAVPVKTVHFSYSYGLCKQADGSEYFGKLTLDSVWFSYNGNTKGRKNPYVFRYNTHNPTYATQQYDRWGNYKSPADNPGGLSNADYPYVIQDSTLAAHNAAAWTLDEITLPSGAQMKVTYESDDYAYVQNKRAMQFMNIAGFSQAEPLHTGYLTNSLYNSSGDNIYVSVKVPVPVHSKEELYKRYLEGIEDLSFRLNVKMPGDQYGQGNEFVPCYAKLDKANGPYYGYFNGGDMIWLKLATINKRGEPGGSFSPLTMAALQFLRLNLPSKAFPGSDIGDDVNVANMVKVLGSMADNIRNTMHSFEENSRIRGWARDADLSRSFVRLNSPAFKKYGGGLRVKRVVTSDNWNKMTHQATSQYGQEYQYTTSTVVNGDTIQISSGVAAYEPVMGGEENPFRQPVYYTGQVAALAPVTLGYAEEPFGESFFPAPMVGYSKVRVSSINKKNTRSANGFTENCFYTTYDYPTLTDRTLIDGDTKKRYKPSIDNFLKINARHFVAVSQGFRVELNDMNGKPRSQAVYAETDPYNPVTSAVYYYKTTRKDGVTRLDNTVLTLNNRGIVNSGAVIGKDIELMTDMRQEHAVTNANNANLNADLFSFGIPPVMIIPSLFNFSQREENLYRSVAMTKVINRHGIIDSVVAVDKGSRVATHNLLYDEETGDVLLTSVQNEYNDPLYHFSYPTGWMYEGMSGAYKNIQLTMTGLSCMNGRIIKGFPAGVSLNDYFYPGDEILVYAKSGVGGTECEPWIAAFPGVNRIWAVDANITAGGQPDIYFMTKEGMPFNGEDATIKIIRSGRKNMFAAAGEVTMLSNPLTKSSGDTYTFDINAGKRIINASAVEYKQLWKVQDKKLPVKVPPLYENDMVSRYFRAVCPGAAVDTLILYTVPYGKYTGSTKQEANLKAENDLAANGPAFAEQHKRCGCLSPEMKKVFYNQNCPEGAAMPYTYTVPAGKYLRATCEEALQVVLDSIDINGQREANERGICGCANAEEIGSFYSQVCTMPIPYAYVVPAGKYVRATCEEARQAALADIAANGQREANEKAVCWCLNDAKSMVFYKNDCPTGIGAAVTFTVEAGMFQAPTCEEANKKAKDYLEANGQAYANAHGGCYAVYAKLTYENQSSTIAENGIAITERFYADIKVSFYQDAACTMPLSVQNMAVTVNRHQVINEHDEFGSRPPVETDLPPITAICNGTSQVIAANELVRVDQAMKKWVNDHQEPPTHFIITINTYTLLPVPGLIVVPSGTN
ncbi:PA14 domain-containing protein [Chitinophaga eiseniae]|uniref:PA14 domain-containing protein n=1 Tax=Chitinophaga eiseniae TaxID=634771 RepID=A0A1T4TIB7_9BACT|nr:DUF5977 domain-containing protein [Chitinophaga eiseniae]SKA40202.1 PA14 domain-containing protein [Chitinophaga eiseniae]